MAVALVRTPIRVTTVSTEHHLLLTKQKPSLPAATNSTLVEEANCDYCDLLLVSLLLVDDVIAM
jgi:hypothetical protein